MLSNNRVLCTLSQDEWRRLQPHLERIRLPPGRILYEVGDSVRHVYFPLDGLISLLSTMESGGTAEVAVCGNEGVVGLPVSMPANTSPYRALVQIACEVYRLRSDVFASEFRRAGSFQEAVLVHLQELLAELVRSGGCNRHHTVKQRLCRWLLMIQDRVHSDTIVLTQEFIGYMLGADRKRISAGAAVLQDAGIIRQRHGRIRIMDRAGLMRCACECYDRHRQRAQVSGTAPQPRQDDVRPIPR